MNPIFWAMWSYWWRQVVDPERSLNHKGFRSVVGRKEAILSTLARCTACGQPGHVAASCTHELWRPR